MSQGRAGRLLWHGDEFADERERELDSGAVASVPLEVAVARLEARFQG
jgi:hypothetical protein